RLPSPPSTRSHRTLSLPLFVPRFLPSMQRSSSGSQFGAQQSALSMAPHPVPGVPVHHSSYQQAGHSYGQYGPPGIRW
uniref:Uncharacterized protein n=1 Tax=Amphilophus citrinellus TaxID=61819 RepID=A0A3Q0SMM7_AMPCI